MSWPNVVLILGLTTILGWVWPLAELMWRDWWMRRWMVRRDRVIRDAFLRSIEPTMKPLPRTRSRS